MKKKDYISHYRIIYPISIFGWWTFFILYISLGESPVFMWLGIIAGITSFIVYIIIANKLNNSTFWFLLGFVGLTIHWLRNIKKITKLDRGSINNFKKQKKK
ncbi:MAG: hypothetical protein ABH849_00640 [Nanoarchaeota archaeon]